MISAIISVLAAAAAASGSPDASSSPAAPTPVAASHKQTDLDKQNRVECRYMETTGSLLGGQRVCKTHGQWEDEARMAREQTENYQSGGAAKAGH